MSIRKIREDDKVRIAEIFVFNNRINYFPIFRDEAFSFSELNVGAVVRSFCDIIAPEECTYVYDDGIIRGFFAVSDGELLKLYADPFFQGRGIGGKMLGFAVELLGAHTLWVLEKNTRAAAFYSRFGFAPTGERMLEPDTTEYLLRMVREK